MKKHKKLSNYFIVTGFIFHILVIVLFAVYPSLLLKIVKVPLSYYYEKQASIALENIRELHSIPVKKFVDELFLPWVPKGDISKLTQAINLNNQIYTNVADVLSALNDGDRIEFLSGVYQDPIVIEHDNITIVGVGHVIFEHGAAHGKGFILSKGNNLVVQNIECRHITVKDSNGACIRQEGTNLTLENVFFHSSENGILETSKSAGKILIKNSRFQQLGKSGRAHGIYANTAEVLIENSLFLATKDQGHAIKNRGKKTSIRNAVIASLNSDDSRLIDIPNGGILELNNSFLQQGPITSNGQAIGFGLENVNYKENKIILKNNIFLLERFKTNNLLESNVDNLVIDSHGNVVISKNPVDAELNAIQFTTREQAGFPNYPKFPTSLCEKWSFCPIRK